MKAKWIVRIVVGLVLVAALVLGLMDYRAKTAAQDTADALGKFDINTMTEADVKASIVGSPEVKTQTLSSARTKVTYTWPGTLRSYRIEIDVVGDAKFEGKRAIDRFDGPLQD